MEHKIGGKISKLIKYYVHPLYDCYLLVVDGNPFFLKVNLSPETRNFWKELSESSFNFHPKVISYSSPEDEFKYMISYMKIANEVMFTQMSASLSFKYLFKLQLQLCLKKSNNNFLL